jgi:hypothetical protein
MRDTLLINSVPTNQIDETSAEGHHWQSDIFVREKNLVDHLKKVFYFLDEPEILSVIHGKRE